MGILKKDLFTNAEWRHLMTILRDVENEGSYYGNRLVYWNRHNRIIKKLSKLAKENNETSKHT